MSTAPNFVQTLEGKPSLGEKVYHPDFHLTLKPMWHPDHTEAEARVAKTDSPYILAHYGSQKAVEHYLSMSMPSFGGLCYPHAKADRIYFTERMMSITTLIDDTTTNPEILGNQEKQQHLRQQYRNAINGIKPPDTFPIAQLLYEGLRPIKQQLESKPRVWTRMESSLHTMIDRQTDSLALQMNELTFERYLELRRIDNYGDWAALMTEYAIDVDMTDVLNEEPYLNIARTAAIDSITLVNDPYSFRKEIHIADSVNSVWLLMRNDGLTLQQALYELAQKVRDNEKKLIQACRKVLSGKYGTRPDVKKYVVELEHLASGNAEFHAISTRYFGEDFAGKRFVSGEIEIKPLPSTDEVAAVDIAGSPITNPLDNNHSPKGKE
ncbi:terpene synthase family protein [Vibrio sp. V39_P1S14PM300]|uniref:terpene synthase family protein n=1 Tax=Vibrio sp. V39_P1S14PM300 TaxID=1938690 RepID=UPI001373102D|nr:methyltransferase type 12 [Vibrio sp. V39_P1S14PM300]NAX20032.1 methyltransferase type 12 [Vibrio sp. V39_P1S14PM300]